MVHSGTLSIAISSLTNTNDLMQKTELPRKSETRIDCTHVNIQRKNNICNLTKTCQVCQIKWKWGWWKMMKCPDCRITIHKKCFKTLQNECEVDLPVLKEVLDVPETRATPVNNVSEKLSKTKQVQCEAVEVAVPKLPSYLEKLPYAEGQWMVTNLTGKKIYSKSFLLQLENEAICKIKPDILGNWPNITKSPNTPQYGAFRVQGEAVEVAVPKLPSYLEKLPYAEGQWKVTNLTGKKIYSKSFFLQLENEAICKIKPDILGNWPNITKSPNTPQYGAFRKPGAKKNYNRQRSTYKKPKTVINITLSSNGECNLNKCMNPWIPRVAMEAAKSKALENEKNEILKTEELYKDVRSILNKITSDNMNTLIEQFKVLPINSIERLEKTIDLVFEKAVEEQTFAFLYASLCSAMQSVKVSGGDSNEMISFKTLIISKCKHLFQLNKTMYSSSSIDDINSCDDPEKKRELILNCEDNERKSRKRSVGNCRFIGELYKNRILSPKIMLSCINSLIILHTEQSLECLCVLLRTIGKELEQTNSLKETFDKLLLLKSHDMKPTIPSRIRFMIQDVIDLRKDGWISKRRTVN